MNDVQKALGNEVAEAHTRKNPLVELAHKIGKEAAGPAAIAVDKEARFPREGIDALKREKLLSAYVPKELGGRGCSITDLAAICHTLGQYCASTAMVFAMHQIQVVCIVRHAKDSAFFESYLKDLVAQERLIASVTSEVGIGGDLRSSKCGVVTSGGEFSVEKDASVISYGAEADDLLLTSRRTPEAPANDQVLVLLKKGDYQLERKGDWDTLGMRGTCSLPFLVKSKGAVAQVLPEFGDIAAQTMVPVSHLVWASLWSGIATDALARARMFVQGAARKNPGTMPPGAVRLAEVANMHQYLRNNIQDAIAEYERIKDDPEALSSIGFAIRTNNLKISTSQLIVDMVSRALMVCGIMGYKADTKFSLGRHLRDAYGAGVMVNNDRILGTNASLLLVHKEAQ